MSAFQQLLFFDRREIAALKQNEPKNENTLSWFHSLSDKENDGVRQTYQEKSMPKGTSNLTLQVIGSIDGTVYV